MGLIDTEEAAKRLVRVILSDIELYRRERPKAGETLESQIEEGRKLFGSRVAPGLLPLFSAVLADREAAKAKVPSPELTPPPPAPVAADDPPSDAADEPTHQFERTPGPVTSSDRPTPRVSFAAEASTGAERPHARLFALRGAPEDQATPGPEAIAHRFADHAEPPTPGPAVASRLHEDLPTPPGPAATVRAVADQPTPGPVAIASGIFDRPTPLSFAAPRRSLDGIAAVDRLPISPAASPGALSAVATPSPVRVAAPVLARAPASAPAVAPARAPASTHAIAIAPAPAPAAAPFTVGNVAAVEPSVPVLTSGIPIVKILMFTAVLAAACVALYRFVP